MKETCEKETAIMYKCSCDKPEAAGWHNEDPIARAQNKAAEEMAGWIANVFFTKSEKVFYDLMETVANDGYSASFGKPCDWQKSYNSREFTRVGDNWECCDQVAKWHDCDKEHQDCFTLVCEFCGLFDRDCENVSAQK